MPSFYPQAMPGHLPLTPPEFVPSYESNTRPAQYTHDPYMTSRHDSGMDYSQQYSFPQSQIPQISRAPGYHNPQSLPPISSYYEPMGAPILPPLRIPENFTANENYRLGMQQNQLTQTASQQQVPKEEKATGGVSAKLDYEMERMTDFVSEAAQGMYALYLSHICLADIDICRSIQPGIAVAPSFRKWVLQVLSATRLPSATIVLSLHYLAVRIRNFPKTIPSSENQIYRLLAVSMILGSKFLDDNTFINRSWSDVTGIKVTELNKLEKLWLEIITFDLHCDPSDPNGVAAWLHAWKEHDAQATSKARISRLSPLDTNIQGQPSMRTGQSAYKQQYTKPSFNEFTPTSSASSSTFGGTPYQSADPWNRQERTPVDSLYNSQHRYRTLEELDHASHLASLAQGHRNGTNLPRASLPPLQLFAPTYYSPWNPPSWGTAHALGCNCMMCARQYSSYMMGSGHAAQTAVG